VPLGGGVVLLGGVVLPGAVVPASGAGDVVLGLLVLLPDVDEFGEVDDGAVLSTPVVLLDPVPVFELGLLVPAAPVVSVVVPEPAVPAAPVLGAVVPAWPVVSGFEPVVAPA